MNAEKPGPVLGSVCTGYGGLDLGVLTAFSGGRIAWCADPDPHVAQILAARMPGVPNLGDIRTVDWTAVEPVDVLTAGFPCQDISAAGRRAGIENGARSGLWTEIVAAVRLLRPALLVVENVAALRWKNGGLHRVLGDLAASGYDALWRSLRASDIGAAHRRERVFHSPGPDMLPTPTAHDGSSNGISAPRRLGGPTLLDQLRLLPTPRASDTGTAGRRAGAGFRPPLSQQVLPLVGPKALLPTPRATDGTKGCPSQRGSKGDLMLPSAVMHLPSGTEP